MAQHHEFEVDQVWQTTSGNRYRVVDTLSDVKTNSNTDGPCIVVQSLQGYGKYLHPVRRTSDWKLEKSKWEKGRWADGDHGSVFVVVYVDEEAGEAVGYWEHWGGPRRLHVRNAEDVEQFNKLEEI